MSQIIFDMIKIPHVVVRPCQQQHSNLFLLEPYEEVITDSVLPLGAVGPWWWWPIITGFTLGSLFNNNILY